MDIHRILVPVDFSEHSSRALDDAIGLAKKFGAELHLLHCHQLFPVVATVAPYDIALPETFERAVREGSRRLLSEWGHRSTSQGVPAKEHLCVGAPSSAIADLAEKLSADLIVMGTRGLSSLQHVLLGSVAERTVRIAPCPVLTVKCCAVAP